MLWKINTPVHVMVIGLGYVGLPTALAFSKKYKTTGIDINEKKIEGLKAGMDSTGQYLPDELKAAKNLKFDTCIRQISEKIIYIVTVPTPINTNKKPDLSFLENASIEISKYLKNGDVVIYESTTFPGCTEELCIPLLEKGSNLYLNTDFGVGYSPERYSPGESKALEEIVRITSGSNPEIAAFVDDFYKSVLRVKTYRASSIKIAEAAKLVENCQRDVNISFMNELALLFDKMNIDTRQVLEAATTKWNFLPFKPGLVGGHCISVDPYYMMDVAQKNNYLPTLIGAGREINEGMGSFVAQKCLKILSQKGFKLKGTKALILGFAYKANCSDFRNTKVIDIYQELSSFGLEVHVADEFVNAEAVFQEFELNIINSFSPKKYDLIIHAVAHKTFKNFHEDLNDQWTGIVFDATGTWPAEVCHGRL